MTVAPGSGVHSCGAACGHGSHGGPQAAVLRNGVRIVDGRSRHLRREDRIFDAGVRTVSDSRRRAATSRNSSVGPGAAGPLASRAASARMLPSATTSSGCSITTGASPSARCSSVATSGIRLDPPTRNTPASRPSGRSRPAQQALGHLHGLLQHRPGQLLQLLAGEVDVDVEQRHHQVGGLGAGQPLLGDPDVVPELPLGPPVLHRRRLDQPLPLPGPSPLRGARRSRRRRRGRRCRRGRRRPAPRSPSPVRATTLASNVPAPKSCTTTTEPIGTSRPSTSAK